jgi:hypothetical protein
LLGLEEIKDYETMSQDIGTVKITDPKQIEAAKLLFETFKNFTYIATILNGKGMVQTAGTERIGFSLMQMGYLTIDKVNALVEAMKETSLEDFKTRIVEQFKTPSLATIIKD